MVEGDLSDLTLPSLLHALSQEGSTSVLRLRRGTDLAAVYFCEGTLVHAQAGQGEGDEALFELLAWGPDGRFRLTRDPDERPRTISAKLATVVTSIVPGRSGGAPGAGSGLTVGNGDERLLHDLLTQLSRLEQDKARLEGGCVDGGLAAALAVMTGVVNSLVEIVVARCSDPDVLPGRVLARLAEEHPYTQLLGEEMNRITISTAADVLQTCTNATETQRQLFLDLCRALLDVLTFYGNTASTLFRAHQEREEWRATFSVFVEGLWTAVHEVKALALGDAPC
jgi:hypothetical protein